MSQVQIIQEPKKGDRIRVDVGSSPGVVYVVDDVRFDESHNMQLTLLSPVGRKVEDSKS